MGIKRRGGGGSSPAPKLRPGDCIFAVSWPHLWEFLSAEVYDDGSARQTGTLLLCVGDGRVRLWVNDRDASASAWVSGDSVQAALESAEAGLEGDSLEWRAARNPPKKR